MANDPGKEFLEKLRLFPCAFNLGLGGRITNNRFKSIRHNLGNELKKEKDDVQEEKIRKKNMLTWALFHLDEQDEAVELNNEVVIETNNRNISSLGNRAFIMWRLGNEQEAENCLEKLELLKQSRDFDNLLTEAVAEHAYYHTRMGGIHSIQMSIKLFKDVVKKQPNNYEWKFGLGLTSRRATDPNVYCSFTESWDVEELIKTAADCLFDVGENGEVKVRGLSYAQLVVMKHAYPHSKYDELFRNKTIFELCDNALQYGSSTAAVLTHCGRSLKRYDLDKAIDLLEQAEKLRSNSTTYHHLGMCYEQKASPIARRECDPQSQAVDEDDSPINRLRLQVQDSMSVDIGGDEGTNFFPLDINDPWVKKAVECYKKAEQISQKQNLPASFSLGFLFKRCGQIPQAEEQFNKVTNSPFANTGNRMIVINAYEQAGLCLLESSKSDEYRKEKTKEKLTKAISLAADVASTLPELEKCAQEVWKSFRTLERNLETEDSTVTKNKDLLRLLTLVRDHGRSVEVVKAILAKSDAELDDPEIIKIGLESYLKLKHFEDALVFLRFANIRPTLTESREWNGDEMTQLRAKVLMATAFERLANKSDMTTDLFQQAFQLKYGKCFGGMAEETNVKNDTCEIVSDVLILYDDVEGDDTTTKIADTLQKLFTSVFGLRTSHNLEECHGHTLRTELQLREVTKYQLIIILLGNEERDGLFDAVIKCIPSHIPNGNVVTVSTGIRNTEVDRSPEAAAARNSQDETALKTSQACRPLDNISFPSVLKSYRHLNLQDIGWLSEPGQECVREDPSVEKIIQTVFGGDIKSLMKLFEFVVDWTFSCQNRNNSV